MPFNIIRSLHKQIKNSFSSHQAISNSQWSIRFIILHFMEKKREFPLFWLDNKIFLFPFQYWLDVDKQMCHQVGLSSLCFNSPSTSLQEPLLRFCVKFYTPDPAQIEEEYTRYLFSLQIKRDLATGLLQCNDNTAALMASYIVQCKS